MQSCITGSFFNWFKVLFGKKHATVLMVGLDSVGQTSILYRLKQNEFVQTIATVGFNLETIEQRGIDIKIMDVGGGDKIRPVWRHYLRNATGHAVIFVVDSNDRDRIGEAGEELSRLMGEDFESAILLVFANKQDIANAMPIIELTDKLSLFRLRDEVKWHIQPSSALTGEGVREGLDWLALQLKITGAV